MLPFSGSILLILHHLGNVKKFEGVVERRSLFFHNIFCALADKLRDGIILLSNIPIPAHLKIHVHA